MSFLSKIFSRSNVVEEDADLILNAPVTGTLASLSEVPDVVISERVVGDGVAIVPDRGELVAPCDGTIIRLLATHNAFSIRAACGLEIYVTCGIGALELRGEGFSSAHKVGDEVKAGDVIVKADLQNVGSRLKSTITSMVVVSSSGAIDHISSAEGHCEAGTTPCLWVTLKH